MKRKVLATLTILGVVALGAKPCLGSSFTPLEWQAPVDSGAVGHEFWGQRKHTQWVRDRNHNFIDDLIDSTYKTRDTVNVIVELNRCYRPDAIEARFHGFGHVRYVGRILTFVLLDRVAVSQLDALAGMDDVAMVELQVRGRTQIPYTARSVEARSSKTYLGQSAQDRTPPLTGAGVTIAFLDTGVDDYDPATGNGHDALPTRLYGFDAVTGTDPGDGKTNPCASDPSLCSGHGTLVAGVTLSRGVSNINCYLGDPGDDEKESSPHCVGVAPGANLVDIRVCQDDVTCDPPAVLGGLDWLALNADADKIRVANMSIGFCAVDDNTSAICELVDYIVAMGVTFVVPHGNYDTCSDGTLVSCDATDPKSTWRAMAPGTAAEAITVSGVQDSGVKTVTRSDDIAYKNGLEGPVCDFNPATSDRGGLKPDLSAPAYNVLSTELVPKPGHNTTFTFESGTSVASPHVAGAAAIILEARPSIDPASLKDLLMNSADASTNHGYYGSLAAPYDHWDRQLGMGMLNIGNALQTLDASTADVGFPSCVGDPGTVGSPCLLASPQPAWLNETDIEVSPSTPVAGVENTITAHITNFGTANATVQVSFGIYDFGVGTRSFYVLGTQSVDIATSEKKDVIQTWTPSSDEHQCVQVNIGYGADTKYWNNTTQRNLTVVSTASSGSSGPGGSTSSGSGTSFHALPPPSAIMRVENPFLVPARFRVTTRVSRQHWTCKVDAQSFSIDPQKDCPKEVGVRIVPPANAPPGQSCNCDVYVYGGTQNRLIGGVTVKAVKPGHASIAGRVVDGNGNGLPGVRLVFTRGWPFQSEGERPPLFATTGGDGTFSAKLSPKLTYRVRLEGSGVPSREVGLTPGSGTLRIELTSKEARILR